MRQEKVTMYTIADAVGMSVAAVSRAFDPHSRLKPEKRQKILETARELGYVPNKMAARLSGEVIKIGVLIYGEMETYYRDYVTGIRRAHEKFADYKVDCDLRILDKNRNTQEEAAAVLGDFISEGVDGAVVSGMRRASCAEELNRLADAGIPFYLLDSDVPGCRRCGVSMNDTETAGRMAAQLLACAVGNGNRLQTQAQAAPAPVAVLTSDLAYQSQRSLADAFCRAAEGYRLRVECVIETHNSPALAEAAAERLFSDIPSLAGIYISSANSASVCAFLGRTGRRGTVGIVASDITEDVSPYLRDGTVFAAIDQDPVSQAQKAFEALFHRISDKEETPEFLCARPQAVFASNLNLYEAKG